MVKDEAYFTEQESLDANIYESNRSMFETLLLMTLSEVREGKEAKEKIDCLLSSYNRVSKSCQQLVGKIRRLESK